MHEFWESLPCYIMETDYTEALTPICASLTNLAECQLHANDVEASTSKSSGSTRATDSAGLTPGTDVVPLQEGGPCNRHAQPSEDPEPEHRPLHGRHEGAGDPAAGQVPGGTHRVYLEPEDVGGQADSGRVSEKLPQDASGFPLEPASEQRAEQPDRELRQPLPGEAQPHLQRRPQRSPWQGMRSERALTCQPAALINRRKQPPLHVCCQLDFE
nr:uncharacterized protein LOC110139285 isoform X2 [Odocoileus virginianus texanus]